MEPTPLTAYLQADDAALEARWQRLAAWLQERFHRATSIEAVLFLIGIQSRGRGYEPELEKETKQDLVMEGTYCAFEALDLYRRVGMDADGFWLWERTTPLPELSIEAQEKLLRLAILAYFADTVEEV